MNIIIGIIIFLFVIVAAYFGAFNDVSYTNKYLRKYATPIKRHLEIIKRMENADKIETVIALKQNIDEGIEAINMHYRVSDVKGQQVCNEAVNRYFQIHGEYLDEYQKKAINRDLDYSEFYSLCLVHALECYCNSIKLQIDALKTKPAKERRREKVIEAISKCIQEINSQGKPEYLAPIFVYGKQFNIDIGYELSDIFLQGGNEGMIDFTSPNKE